MGGACLLDRVQVAGVRREVEQFGAHGLHQLLQQPLLIVVQCRVVADEDGVGLRVGAEVGQDVADEGVQETHGIHRLGHEVGGGGGAGQLGNLPAQHPCAPALSA